MRIGMGYDVHRLIEGRRLILGGVNIPFEKGLLGHSDADVLIHAIMDALLGAASLGDIGKHFPDSNPEYKDASSIALLRQVGKKIEGAFYVIENIDATIVAQKPKLLSYIPQMVEEISKALELPLGRINVKATTEEGLGFTGNEEGISAHAVCLLEQVSNYAYEDPMTDPKNCEGCSGCPLMKDKDGHLNSKIEKGI